MFQHKLPNGNIIRSDNLPRELAIKRMIDEERWMQEHREELEFLHNNCSTICLEVE